MLIEIHRHNSFFVFCSQNLQCCQNSFSTLEEKVKVENQNFTFRLNFNNFMYVFFVCAFGLHNFNLHLHSTKFNWTHWQQHTLKTHFDIFFHGSHFHPTFVWLNYIICFLDFNIFSTISTKNLNQNVFKFFTHSVKQATSIIFQARISIRWWISTHILRCPETSIVIIPNRSTDSNKLQNKFTNTQKKLQYFLRLK